MITLYTALARDSRREDRSLMPDPVESIVPSVYAPIESHRLHIFHAVAEMGSVAQAARQLCLTRSALSHALRTLEADLGCDLFDRQDRKMVLTDAGRRFLPQARAILEAMEQARRSLHAA